MLPRRQIYHLQPLTPASCPPSGGCCLLTHPLAFLFAHVIWGVCARLNTAVLMALHLFGLFLFLSNAGKPAKSLTAGPGCCSHPQSYEVGKSLGVYSEYLYCPSFRSLSFWPLCLFLPPMSFSKYPASTNILSLGRNFRGTTVFKACCFWWLASSNLTVQDGDFKMGPYSHLCS